MKPIYDRRAQVVGWLCNDILYDRENLPVGYYYQDGVFASCGRLIGTYDAGIFRDKLGCIVGFTQRGPSDSVLPCPGTFPVPPPHRRRLLKRHLWRTQIKKRRHDLCWRQPMPLLNWSAVSWKSFIQGDDVLWPWDYTRPPT